MTLDEKTEDDECLEMGGLSFIADNTFLSAQGQNFSIESDARTGMLRVIALDRVGR